MSTTAVPPTAVIPTTGTRAAAVARSPVIVIGAHRSGTSLATRLLRDLGLFIGRSRDRNDEALFFQHLNDWVLRQCGGAWDHPMPVRTLLANEPLRRTIAGYLRHVMSAPRVMSYLGLRRYVRYRTPPSLPGPWGWKDPRNSFTLPLWLDLFPDARVVHVCRHGVDVANSLKVRQDRSIAAAVPGRGRAVVSVAARRRGIGRLRTWVRSGWVALASYVDMPLHWRFANSVRCMSLDGAFDVWEEYTDESAAHVARLGRQALTVRFEDLLAEPERGLRELARFCGLPAPDGRRDLVAALRTERAYGYRQHPELRTFARSVESRLAARGYQA